ncbi:LysR family transcriptional regulator ArgP [Homoserinimonas hongtaonis]|uniref:LysR family transcriptional regulator ArgP n=1 Tax=Homoserinimonas hongtaonis TaxID=2079791 RepID=UPI000D3774AD|nr:LysR family transcriptional regulator ArgP [Salinibacterium hongtaonis]AWB89947.1 ArgP/LysG family DNA-binding transcriptional regulator [Salinibacterium hongtaonis]
MQIPLDLARTVATVIDEGSLEGAARALHITPSAVSQRVKALEERMGRVLLVRSRPVRATDAGTAIVRLARQMALLEHDALAEAGLDDESTRFTSVGIAVSADSLATWLLPALAAVARRHPVVFDLRREDEEYTTELLETGQVMAAVTARSIAVAGCVVSPLRSMRYRASASTEFAARWFADGGTPAEFAVAPIVDFDRRDEMQTNMLRRLGVAGNPPRHYVPASSEFVSAVSAGMGWGMIPDEQRESHPQLVGVGPDNTVEVPLFWQQWNLRSELLTAVADEVARAAGTR